MLNPSEVYYNRFNAGLMPDPALLVWEWADTHRMLPRKGASEPGKWQTARTPYLKEIMSALSPLSPTERIIFMKGAQVGGQNAGSTGSAILSTRPPALPLWFNL